MRQTRDLAPPERNPTSCTHRRRIPKPTQITLLSLSKNSKLSNAMYLGLGGRRLVITHTWHTAAAQHTRSSWRLASIASAAPQDMYGSTKSDRHRPSALIVRRVTPCSAACVAPPRRSE